MKAYRTSQFDCERSRTGGSACGQKRNDRQVSVNDAAAKGRKQAALTSILNRTDGRTENRSWVADQEQKETSNE